MPYTKIVNGKSVRDYPAELAWEKRNPQKKRQEKRVARNGDRSKVGGKVGDGKHVDHKDGNPLNRTKSNLTLVSAGYNLSKEANKKKLKLRKT